MRVFVATHERQGFRESDFCYCAEGELVTMLPQNVRAPDSLDGSTGSQRALIGLDCGHGTTTFRVTEKHITRGGLKQRILEFAQQCWGDDNDSFKWWAEEVTGELIKMADHFPLEAVLELRGDVIQVRETNASPRESIIILKPQGGTA